MYGRDKVNIMIRIFIHEYHIAFTYDTDEEFSFLQKATKDCNLSFNCNLYGDVKNLYKFIYEVTMSPFSYNII